MKDDTVREFCSRELVAYYMKDGESSFPVWRRVSSYKIAREFSINPVQTEGSLLAELEATFGVKLTPDVWISSIGDTEEHLLEADRKIADGGFTICARRVPADMYSDDPKVKGIHLTIVTPTPIIRNIVSATRREFVERLLALEETVRVRDRAWFSPIVEFLTEPWKVLLATLGTTVGTVLLACAYYLIKHKWGIDLKAP